MNARPEGLVTNWISSREDGINQTLVNSSGAVFVISSDTVDDVEFKYVSVDRLQVAVVYEVSSNEDPSFTEDPVGATSVLVFL